MQLSSLKHATLLLLATALPLAPVMAQTAGEAATTNMAAGTLDADASAALDRMGAHLRSLGSFRLISNASTEDVFDNGQKLMTQQRTTYTMGGRDKLHVKVETDTQSRDVFYDGKTFTLVAPRAGKYLQIPFSGTVSQMLTRADEDWGIDFPVQDLFRWGDPTATAERPKEGFKVGSTRIGDVMTDHYAFRQSGVDWQIWIDQGDKPLPRKMVITNLEDPAQPQYVAHFTWDTAPGIAANAFDFTPAKADTRIDIKQFAAPAK